VRCEGKSLVVLQSQLVELFLATESVVEATFAQATPLTEFLSGGSLVAIEPKDLHGRFYDSIPVKTISLTLL